MTTLVTLSNSFDSWSKLSSSDKKLSAAKAIVSRDAAELWGLLNAYLHREDAGVSKNTLKVFRSALLRFLASWQDVNLLRPETDRAHHYIQSLSMQQTDEAGKLVKKALSPSSVAVHLAALKQFYEALRWTGLFTETNPFETSKAPKDRVRPEDKRSAYSLEEVSQLFEAALVELKLEDDRLSILTLLAAFAAGLRLEELRLLRWQDLDFRQNIITIPSGKGRKKRLVPLANCYKRVLLFHQGTSDHYVLEHLQSGQLSPYSDTYLRKRIALLCSRAGLNLSYKAVHSLRHSFGYTLHKILPLFVLSKIMGHSEAATTSIYAAPTSSDAVSIALGKSQQHDPYELALLTHRDEGVNALGFVLELGLNNSLHAYWDRLL